MFAQIVALTYTFDWYIFTLGVTCFTLFMGKIVGQTKFSSLGETTSLGEGKL